MLGSHLGTDLQSQAMSTVAPPWLVTAPAAGWRGERVRGEEIWPLDRVDCQNRWRLETPRAVRFRSGSEE
jgi:hypothetical protein